MNNNDAPVITDLDEMTPEMLAELSNGDEEEDAE